MLHLQQTQPQQEGQQQQQEKTKKTLCRVSGSLLW